MEASLKEIRDLLEEDEAQERKLQELLGRVPPAPGSPPGLAEVSKECSKYLELHEKASFTNTELHRAMNLHLGNLRLLGGPLEQVRAALPTPTLSEGESRPGGLEEAGLSPLCPPRGVAVPLGWGRKGCPPRSPCVTWHWHRPCEGGGGSSPGERAGWVLLGDNGDRECPGQGLAAQIPPRGFPAVPRDPAPPLTPPHPQTTNRCRRT